MQPVVFSVAVLALLTGAANAQVFRCTDANGRTVYSDTLCGHAPQRVNPNRPPANTTDASRTLREIREERTRLEAERLLAAQRSAAAAQQAYVDTSHCPSERDIKNMETHASSITLKPGEQQFLFEEIARARACKPLLGDAGRRAAVNAGQAQREAEEARLRSAKGMTCFKFGDFMQCN